MIKISIKDAQIGMVAAEPIKTPLGQILALPGTPLTRQLINKMKLYKVGSISIQNPSYAAAPQAGENTAKRDKVKPVPKTRAHEMVTNIQRVQASEEFRGFQLKYITCINQIKDTFGKICAGEKSLMRLRFLLLSLTFPHRAALQSRPLTCSTTCAPLQTRCTHTV